MRRNRTPGGRFPLLLPVATAFLLVSLVPLGRGTEPAPAYLATPLSEPSTVREPHFLLPARSAGRTCFY